VSKIAIFTEGQIEQIFAERLLIEMAGHGRIRVSSWRVFGGRRYSRIFLRLSKIDSAEGHSYEALIIDCGADQRVASEIREQYETMIRAGFTAFLAIRDVAPNFSRADKPRLSRGFNAVVPQKPISPILVLATMEVEAWFIGEHTHFSRLDTRLTASHVSHQMGIDIAGDDIESWDHPAQDLHNIYALAGLSYTKTKAEVERTVNALDFSAIRNTLPTRTPSIQPLIQAIESFLT
jgi:hypothetical protein